MGEKGREREREGENDLTDVILLKDLTIPPIHTYLSRVDCEFSFIYCIVIIAHPSSPGLVTVQI